MAGHSRTKDGVASLAYAPAIPTPLAPRCPRIEVAGTSPAMTTESHCINQSGLKFIATPLMQ